MNFLNRMKLSFMFVSFFLSVGCSTTSISETSEIKALIVGNNYESSQLELENPINDARLISRTIGELGHENQILLNSDFEEFDSAMATFAASLESRSTAIFYYSGHGVQWQGANYIILEDETAVSIDSIVNALKAKSENVIVILDACRSRPEHWRSDASTKTIPISFLKEGKGLTRLDTDAPVDLSRMAMGDIENVGLAEMRLEQDGLFIAFATAPNGVAFDYPLSSGASMQNSPFAQSLAESMTMSLEFSEVLNMTSSRVIDLTEQQQIPWRQSSMRDGIFLAGRPSLTNSGSSQGPSMPPL